MDAPARLELLVGQVDQDSLEPLADPDHWGLLDPLDDQVRWDSQVRGNMF